MIPIDVIRGHADRIRSEYLPASKLPVDVDIIVEKMGIEIVPLANLRRDSDVDAFLSPTGDEIYVDQEYFLSPRQTFRVRFDLAHELGHAVLHREILKNLAGNPPVSISEWIHLVTHDLTECMAMLDSQANEFAGRLLVPLDALKQKAQPIIHDATKRFPGIRCMDPNQVRSFIAGPIHREFGVADITMAIRLQRESIFP